MDTGPLTRGRRGRAREPVRLLGEIPAALITGSIVVAIAGLSPSAPNQALDLNSPVQALAPQSAHGAIGELRCEGRGAIVINIDGKDYAVNGMAGSRYPPIQSVWTKDAHPEIDIDRLIVQGITLCAW